eukprot:8009973-Pyramimonas_sp.AAC.1
MATVAQLAAFKRSQKDPRCLPRHGAFQEEIGGGRGEMETTRRTAKNQHARRLGHTLRSNRRNVKS